MKRLAMLSLVLVMFVVAGCPLLTKNSMDRGSYEVPGWMAGTWNETTGKTVEVYDVDNGKRTGTLKYVKRFNPDRKADASSGRELILSTVGKKIYAFAYEVGDDSTDTGYYIYEFRPMTNNEFQLIGLKEKLIQYNASPEQIRHFLAQNKDNESILDKSEIRKFVKQ